MDFGFQVRISKNDFPWLADHVVHQTPIVPAAGYIEIILEALKPKNDQFVHFKSIDFLSPCEISEIPVSLQTNLEQVLGTNSDYKFKIFSRTYDVSSTKKIHCTGQVSLKSQIPQTKNIESLVVDKFENTRFQSKADFYGHMQAIIGDNFQYGPKFQVIKTIQCNPETKELLIDLEMDEQLFQDSIKAGYILPPSLMDGGLQSFIYFLMLGVDIAGIPIRAKDLAVFGAPTTNKLICHYTPNLSMANIQQKGQLTLPLGEQCSGLLEIYDRETGLLLVKLGEYYSFHSNTKRGDLKFSKSFIQWQPKYIDSITFPKENLTIPLTLKIIEESNSKKKRIARFVEIAGQSLEKETILHQCLDQLSKDDSQSEYWLFNDEDSLVEKQFEYFNHHNSSLRFESINIRELEKNNLSKGLLRPHCAEAVFVKNKPEYLTPDHFEFYSKILIEGGLVIIDSYECDYDPNQVAGWEIVLNHSEIKILQCSSNSYGNTDNYPGDIIFLGAENSIFNNWKYAQAANRQIALAGYKDVSFENDILIKWQKEKPIEKLDFLISASEDDPYGHSIFIAFVLLMQQFVRYRQRVDCPHCTIRLVTINAVKNVKNPANSVFWGGVRSLSHEISVKENLGIELIDIDSESAFYLLNWLAENPVREREMMVRGNKIFVPRIHQIYEEFPTTKEKHTHPFKLTIDNPGQISGLQMKTYELPALGDFDVEIEVKAAALNFRDIMVMLGKLPLLSYERSELGHEVGMEACGIIRKVGKKVRSRKIGDEVLFMKGGCIANRIITNEDTTFTKPDNLTIEEGAGVLSVYVTAYYALVYLARLRRGQKVLIHSAMGGVGQAAIAIAKYLGAEIYTTAGNEEKRKNLIALGAKAAFDSHSYTWYDDLMLATQGDGVDVVLNSLAGHHIHLCLESLTPGGYHCEIGKVDIYADNTLNMCVFRKNLRFIAIDVDRLMQDDPALSRQLTKECMNLLAESKLPPIPVTIYPVAKYESAIRSMMNGEHKGKLILSLENLTEQSLSIVDDSKFLKAEATYLITGGFGGIGLQLIAYLADAGAKHITLLDRDKTGRRTADWVLKQSSLNQLYPETEIDIVPGDVTNRADVQNCINQLKKPLKGIFHLAGTIDDRLLANLDPQSIESVFLPKATGAMNLHDATKSMELDHFVMCSSIASVFGSPAQINYSAANAFLDGLADYRQNNNLPGLTFNMGAIAESGMASRDAHVLRLAKTSGIPPISTLFAIYGLDYGMRRLSTQSQLITALIKDIKWTADHPDYMRFGRVVKNQEMFKKGVGGQFTIEAVVQKVSKKVAELCGHEEIDPKEPIASFGLNSISVSELGAYINAQFNYQASVIDLMSKATAISLAQSIIDAKSTSEVSQKEIGNIETEDTGQKVEDKDAFIVPRRPSQFANKTEDHFANYQKIEKSIPKLTISDNVLIKTNGVKKTTFVTSDQKQSTETIAKLSGTLPPECQKDLDSIKGFIRKINSKHSNMLMAKKPTEFENVLLTGATGFIGRFILQEILQSDDQLTVFCLVRADSAEHGLIRIREAMKVAGIWNSTFESRIKPIIGDIGKPNFDIEEVKYHQLEQTIDAIYHYAADLTLASPYNQIRNINTVSIKNILTLAFTGQIKPIFYASTLGIFPQYFSQFRNEFSEMKIQHQMNPDINLMKEKFPLGFVGYPWSKLVVEQSLLFAQKLGLPLAIFRLPVTGISAKTGYTQSNDIKVKVASASFQMGIRPKGMEFHWSEPVDTLAKICTSISLNNDRIHTIYQCANPNPETYGIDFIDFGFKLQEVSYENFKSENQSFGSKSPLEGYWTLLDYFAPYWFSNEKTITTQPISDEAIKEDCQFEITWPGLLEMTANSYKWIHEHQELWPFEMFHSELNKEHFIERGKMISSQFRLKFEDIYGKHFLNGLSTLVDSINTESNVRNDRSSIISLNLHRIMKNVALVEKQQNLHPEINDIKIEKPIFIIGINRTGTTFLHHLFSLDDDHSTLKIYESAMPVGKLSTDTKESGDDFRIQYVKDVLASYDAHEKLRGIHNIDITAPEEDFLLLEHAFYSWTYTTLFKVPKYQKWLEKTNPLFAYNFHKKAMQNIVFQRPKSELNKQWIFKMPFHLMELETLLKVYPDAIFIQTHRDPKEFMSSWNHLVYQARSVFAPQISKECIGQEQMDFMSKMLNKATEFRKIHPELENRWIDIPFDQLISNPISIINSIYAKLGKEIDSNHLLKIEKWITDSIERRKKEGTNTHKLSDFKLSGDEVDQAFKIYLDYITTKKMKM
jgi:thioester reductase-like protein